MEQIVIFIIGILLLLFGSDIFVDGAAGFSYKKGISPLLVGLTLVAMGTSLPETAVSIMASVHKNGGIAVGNVIGSNILNILIILGISALIRPLLVAKSTIYLEIPFLILVSGITLFIGIDGNFSKIDGCLFLILFCCYLLYLFCLAKDYRKKNKMLGIEQVDTDDKKDKQVGEPIEEYHDTIVKYSIMMLFGLLFVIVGSKMVVESATYLASAFGISSRIIGLTIVALGTSLPELFTSVIATIKNKPGIAMGNIVGSNIFNLIFILGCSSLIEPIYFQHSFIKDALVMIGTAALLWLCTIRKKTLSRFSGILFLVCYGAYLSYLLRLY